ncbi:MAG: type I pullulanase, partial [Longicatena sp.]
PLNCMVPYYYFQMNESGEYSNGTFCGNDIDSRKFMCRRYIVDACRYIQETFLVDGYRFDLMGILDYETMNEIYHECASRNPGFMIYGEGWD